MNLPLATCHFFNLTAPLNSPIIPARLRAWCSGNTTASQAVISGSSPDARSDETAVSLGKRPFVFITNLI
jgi:hypothetical protein